MADPEHGEAERQEREGGVDASLDPLESPEAVRRLVGEIVAAITVGLGALQGGLCGGGVAPNAVCAVPLGIQEAAANLPILSPQSNRRVILTERRIVAL